MMHAENSGVARFIEERLRPSVHACRNSGSAATTQTACEPVLT